MNKKQKKMLWRILITAVLMVVLHFAVKAFSDRVHEPVWFFLYLPVSWRFPLSSC